MEKNVEKSIDTLAVHGGEEEKHASNSITAPIFQTTIFSMDSFADLRRYGLGQAPELNLYVRGDNPTRDVAARKIAALEGAEDGLVTSSGTAASFVIAISLLEAGDEIISMETVYGGTYRLMRDVLPRLGIVTRFLRGDDLELIPSLISERTRMLWIESPTNPLNRVVDLRRAAMLAREHGLVSVVDNTFASPVNQRPISLGFDVVMHSATKYLAGHSDVLAGAVCGRAEVIAKVRKMLVATGAVLDPSAAALLIRGIKTLDVRVGRVNSNAQKLAEFFATHPKIARVYYPGLESSPDHGTARGQMTGFGGVVSVDLAEGSEAAAERLSDALRIIRISTSLGGTETVVTYPIYTSHSGYSDEELARAGVGRGTLRFSVGIESAEDLIGDVARALEAV
ncbi:MAG TPA: aminotransferase class I/II-fold pyridoxal phosphate-dependent enzyme [Blastocatellia bacterium]|nr:aminotransferase class I/II-fold pyridoxal phosphate-dependent enzyme [Blastocatellia bacterium]